jgi:iron(III) transport system substrate-binding protein
MMVIAALALSLYLCSAGVVFAQPSPAVLEGAKKEGRLTWYTSMAIDTSKPLLDAFLAQHPFIKAELARLGEEQLLNRILAEARAGKVLFDVVSSSGIQLLADKKFLAPYASPEAEAYAPELKDAGHRWTAVYNNNLVVMYNTRMLPERDAPRDYPDLLDPKWKGKIVKAHPGYSGTIMTATQQIVRDLGWEYLEKLAQQNVMQVQSASDPPKKLALGERAVQADGNEYNLFQLKEQGRPVEPIYAAEGTPVVVGPNGIFKNAPNPNAARLFQNWCFSAECQQLIIDVGGLRSLHPQAKEHPGRKPFKEIKTMKEDAAAVEKQGADIKARYSKLFKV